jgi:hypothetical protein
MPVYLEPALTVMQRINSWRPSPIRGLRDRAKIRVWDCLAALQSSKPLESSFLLWTSPNDASRRTSGSPLKPYLCRLQRNALVEPGRGFVIADYGLLIETSVSNAYAARDPCLSGFLDLPSPAKYFKAKILRRYRSDLKAVVSLATAWPQNYFHFYRDFLPKILLLEEANIDPALPVIVPDELYDQPFFQEAMHSKRLSRWNFISPRGQYIKCETIVFCSANQRPEMDRSASPDSEVLSRASAGTKFLESPGEVLALLDLDDGHPQARAERRMFLTRSAARERSLINDEQIESLLRERGFEIVDTDGVSLREQAKLFRECRYVIGIHGAGLTNIIHAHDHELSLLELRPRMEEHLVSDFAVMCYGLGFEHQEIFGTSEGGYRDAPFEISINLLRGAIDRMLMPSVPD